MALALDLRKPAGAALRALLQREFVRAERRLAQAASDETTDRIQGVHEFRRCVKRLRAAWRLVRGAVAIREQRRIDQALGGAARRLGSLRDAHARTIAAGRIAALLPRSMRALALDAWRATGGAVSEAAGAMEVEAVRRLVRESQSELEDVRVRVMSMDLDAFTWHDAAASIVEACGTARDRFRTSWEGRDEAWLHDVRKRAQRAANMLLLVGAGTGRHGKTMEARLRVVAGLLGEARDAGLMLSDMPELPKASPLHMASRRMRRMAERHRARCLRRALVAGRAAMTEGRREMRRRMDRALARSA
jgi:CHAD domain-containing protein